MTSPFGAIKNVVYSKGMIDPDQIKGIEVLVAKALGFIDPDSGSRCSIYWTKIDPDIYRGMLACELARHGRMPSWIKKPKPQKPDDIDMVMDLYIERFNLDVRLKKENYTVFRKLIKENIKDVLIQICAEEKLFKKFNIEIH